MSQRIELVKTVMSDPEFVERVASLEEPEDVQKAFEERGVELTLEEINTIAEMVLSSDGDEISEEQLNAVSGGVLAEIAIVASGVALFANCMAEVNKSRKAAGKKTIW